MLPQPLAPLDPHKTRALSTIYAPRKLSKRKPKSVQTRMLDDIPIKPSLSPFHPLPAIGQQISKDQQAKVILLDLNKTDSFRPRSIERRSSIKLQEVLKPLTPLRIPGYVKMNLKDEDQKKPQQLLRENTYDVIEPIYLNNGKEQRGKMETDSTLTSNTIDLDKIIKQEPKISPKTRFKNAAFQVAKLSSMPETGKLLSLRERQTFNFCNHIEDNSQYRLQELPKSPAQKLNKLSEIFQNLEINGRQKDKLKKENSWF